MSRWFRAAIRLPEASPGAVTGAAQVVHFWAIPQQSAGSVNSYEDIAIHLSMSEDTVRTWVKEGKLPFYRVGKRYKFKISEVDEWIRTGKTNE